jgi:hypothetical protein
VSVILGQILMKLEFSGQIFEEKKYQNGNFDENPSSGRPAVPCGRTDGRTDRRVEANTCFSYFFEGVQNLIITCLQKPDRPAVERCTKRY